MATVRENIKNALNWFYDRLKDKYLDPFNERITTNTNNIAANTANIATNTANIATNTTDIATNKTNIEKNATDISQLNSDLTSLSSDITNNLNFYKTSSYNDDCNDLTTPGICPYVINSDATNGPGIYCYLMIFSYKRSSSDSVTQVAFGYNVNRIAIRYRYEGSWSDWNVIS